MATATATNSKTQGEGILALAFEAVAVGIITLIAGINDDMGKAMVTVMVGIWLIYMMTNNAVISSLGNFVSTVTGNA
jgi:hypothetical protein